MNPSKHLENFETELSFTEAGITLLGGKLYNYFLMNRLFSELPSEKIFRM